MMTVNLRLIASIPVFIVAIFLALWGLWCQIMSIVALVSLDIAGLIILEIMSAIIFAVASVCVMIGQAIKGESANV